MSVPMFELPATSQARSRQTRKLFIDAALRLMREHDWNRISIEEIVAEADLSVGAFYKRFGNKSGLLAACVEMMLAGGAAQLSALLATGGDLGQRVPALLQALTAGWIAGAPVVRAVTTTADKQHLQAVSRHAKQTQARLTDWLLDCRTEFHHPNPEAAIAFVFNVHLAGLQTLFARAEAIVGKDDVLEESARMILAYLAFEQK